MHKIFQEFDTDRSGYLDKRETLTLLNTILREQGEPNSSVSEFNRFYAEYDINGDGLLSKDEIARFVKEYLDEPVTGPRPVKLRDETDQIIDLVNKIWN